MAEKPRLKETDEIFSSIGKGGAKAPQLPVLSEQGEEAATASPAPLIESLLDDAEPKPAPSKRASSRSRRRGGGQPKGGQAEPAVDARPLDFGKYDLKQERKSASKEAPLITPPSSPDEEPPKGQKKRQPAEQPAKSAQAKPAAAKGAKGETPPREELPAPPVRRVNPPREQAPAREPERQPQPAFETAAPAPQPPQAPPQPIQPPPQELPEIKPFVFEELGEEAPQPEGSARIIRGSGGEAPPLNPQPKVRRRNPAPEPEPEPQPPAETGPNRDNFLQELSQQFDQAFQSAFEGKKEQETRRRKSRGRGTGGLEFTPKAGADFAADQLDDRQADVEAAAFLHEFEQQVRQEEEVRAELFKDTLTEKFERERERYLRELGIGESPQPAPPPSPAPRRLDIQIEPEMHRREDEKPVARPVTYSRTGDVRPQTHDVEEEPEEPRRAAQGYRPADGKKSSEELLFELARQTSAKRPPPRPMETPAPVVKEKKEKKESEPLRFTHVEEEKPKKKGSSRKIIGFSMLAAVLVLCIIAFPVVRRFLPPAGEPQGDQTPETSVATGNEGAQTLEIYEARNFDIRESYDNIVIKRANISVKNLSVSKQVIIENIESQGSVRLEDMDVGGELYLRNCQVDSLILHNVTAQRLVITNNQARVSITMSGASGIDTVELRTPATLSSQPTQGADLGGGVRSVILKASPETSVLTVTLNGLEIQTLASYDDAVVELGENTRIEQMTSEGSVSVSGKGSVLNLSASPKELPGSVALKLLLPVSQVSVKGTSQVEVGDQVDMLATADNLTLTGTGKVAKLVLDSPIQGGRLMLDISDVGVQLLIANAETRVAVSGEARITELTANESVYALGNKVNLLVVNANRVIYENEPDKIQVTTGIRPPESMADNPNLDYNLSAAQTPPAADTTLDDVSTVCGHTRESGGFLRGDGSKSEPYEVSTPAQLAHVGAHLSSHFIQTEDLDISADTQFISGFPMIASGGLPFSGSYEGMGHSISNLRINSAGENVGLFAENTGTIQNISLVSGEVRGTSEARSFVGALCGLNYQGGVIATCSNGARVVGNQYAYVGGIAGYNYSGRIRDCYNAAKITGVSNVGGIAGVNREDSTVSGCYNVGTIEGGDLDTGAVVGANTGVVTNTYYLVETAEKGIGSGGGTALERDTDEMSSAQTVADLSAGSDDSPWVKSDSSYTYPLLRRPPAREPQPTA